MPVAVQHSHVGESAKSRDAAAARSSSSSTVTSDAFRAERTTIQAEPDPVPVPISAHRPRGRAVTRTASNRPISGIDERSKRIARRERLRAMHELGASVTTG